MQTEAVESFLGATGGVDDGVLAGAVIAALGYAGKQVVQSVKDWRVEADLRRARLHRLQALLEASRTTFLVQRMQADRLAELLRERHPGEIDGDWGLERLFTHFFPRFDSDEKDLHGVVRAYTEHGLRPINEAMLAWLRDDADYRIAHGKNGTEAELAALLNQLDAHLLLWLAKYEGWIAPRPDHALVYLDDEEKHGPGFPKGIDAAVATVISRF